MWINTLTKIRVVIAPYERGVLMRNRAVVDILEPGVYWQLPVMSRDEILTVNVSDARCDLPMIETLIRTAPELVREHFVVADLADNEAGLVYEDGKLVDMLAPGTRALYWKALTEVRIDVVDTFESVRVPDYLVRLIGRSGSLARRAGALDALLGVDVRERQAGLLFENSVLREVLEPGYHMFWKFNRKLSAKVVDTRMSVIDVSGQEILTKDRVSLRVNLSAVREITDPVLAEQKLTSIDEFVYRELQLALRRAIGTRTLDELLADKTAIDESVSEDVRDKLAAAGIVISNIGVKDVILPGDMKDILNQVVEAEKSAQANLIRRREETAATRSLLNTAKLMADNPVLIRLKELEALEKVTTKVDRITVFGGMDSVMKDLVRIDT